MKKLAIAIALASPAILSGCGNPEHEAAISAVKSQMFDPESLQVGEVKDIRVCQQFLQEFLPEGMTEYRLVSMDVNGKNRMGGYAGEKTVYYNPHRRKMVDIDSWMIVTVNTESVMGFIDPEEYPEIYEMNMGVCEEIIDG